MRVILDATALINLNHAELVSVVLSNPTLSCWVAPAVRLEFKEENTLLPLIEGQVIGLLDENSVPASRYLALLDSYNLGAGETESIAFALNDAVSFLVSDDRAARRAAGIELGEDRVTGTLGLVKLAVQGGLLDRAQAWSAYAAMRAKGSFLPALAGDYF